jgi:hypothetical protein
MNEIGSFIELQVPKGLEFFSGIENIARLNSGRAAIYHALTVLNCNTVWLPFYQCETVCNFLKRKNIEIKYYRIDENFNPIDLMGVSESEAVIFVNYYGIMSAEYMRKRSVGIKNVVFDNSQAFFFPPLEHAMNVYSTRKFFGVPDGAYVIGDNAHKGIEDYPQGYSSDTSLFLLQRIEYGCEGEAYKSKIDNDNRIDLEDVHRMSILTRRLLDGTDYAHVRKKRQENFLFASELFKDINKIDPLRYLDVNSAPMVYPLVIENDDLMSRLLAAKHFQGRWWGYLLDMLPSETFEYWLSKNLIPITIDQRYGKEDLFYLRSIVN